MEPIKLLHTADIHIGMENYGRVDPATGINARVMDFLRRLSDVADYAIEQGIDVFLFAGDAYKTRDPNPTYQREFARRVKKIADAGIPVVMLVGNHDLPAMQRRATSISIFDTLAVPNIYVADREDLLQIAGRRGQPLQIATIPYPLRSGLLSREEHQGKSLSELDSLLRDVMIHTVEDLGQRAREHPDVPAILTGHFSVDEASQGSEQNIMIGRDVAVPRSVLCDPVWRYVGLGHIHKHQSLNRDAQPPVIYSGSIERIDFGEEFEKKGFVVAEIGAAATTWEFRTGYHREARGFLTVRVDVREESDPTAAVVHAIEAKADLDETVVRVVVRLKQEQEPLLSEREVMHALEGAYYVAALQKDVVRTERQRLGGISVEALTPGQLLEHYLQLKDVPAERAVRLLEYGQALIKASDDGPEV
jgi:DNA repair protein SbcD/Mre11